MRATAIKQSRCLAAAAKTRSEERQAQLAARRQRSSSLVSVDLHSSGCSDPTVHWLLRYTRTPFFRWAFSHGSHPASARSGMLPAATFPVGLLSEPQ